ncbi:hypothetical protein [Oryzomicrobium sp.]|uniref:hypothetical protein n=1 Tax=Oryzomicrobium sp. TaxID=1911578 RepID=UPI002FDF6AC6
MVARDAVVCPHCEQPEPYSYQPIFKIYAKADTSHKVSGGIILGLGFFALLWMVRCSITPAAPDYSDGTALYMCQSYIKQLLKAPASAQFSRPKFYGANDGMVIAAGTVDAQNGFGVLIRNGYECQLIKGERSWVLIGGQFLER